MAKIKNINRYGIVENSGWKKIYTSRITPIIVVIIMGILIYVFTIGKIDERTYDLKEDIADLKETMDDVKNDNSDMRLKLAVLDSNLQLNVSSLSQRIGLIESKISVKLQESIGGPDLKLGIKDRSYTGYVGYISMKKGDPTFSGQPYDPNADVAAVNMCSTMSTTKIGQIVIVARTEFANDVVDDLYVGPSVNIVINDIFYDYQHPNRLLLLSQSAAKQIGLNETKGIMKCDIMIPRPKIEDE